MKKQKNLQKKKNEKTSKKHQLKEKLKKEVEEKQREFFEKELKEKAKESTEKNSKEEKSTIDSIQLKEFLKPSGKSISPVLEKIASIPQEKTLRKMVASSPIFKKDVETGEVKYTPDSGYNLDYKSPNNGKERYENSPNMIWNKINAGTIEKEVNPHVIGISPQLNARNYENKKDIEKKYISPERLDRKKQKLPFEENKKYRTSNFR